METDNIIRYSSDEKLTSFIEEAFYDSKRQYSLRNLPLTDDISQELIIEALQKSFQVCHLAGINSSHHFKKIYVYDADISTMHIDWRMTKKGINLMVTQMSSLNEKTACWLWEMANL